MQCMAVRETRQRAIDRSPADAGIEYEYGAAAKADDSRRDLVDHGLEYRRRQAAAAGIFGKGRVISVNHGGPDQRIDAIGEPRGQPLGLDPVGIHRQVKSVLLGGGADRQNGRGAIFQATRDLVPGQAFDQMAVGFPAHAPGPQLSPETPVKSPAVTQPCR